MRAKQKRMILEIDFATPLDLKRAMISVADSIAKGIHYDRKLFANCLVEYSIRPTDFPEYRIEEINGQRCMIFTSKMNMTE